MRLGTVRLLVVATGAPSWSAPAWSLTAGSRQVLGQDVRDAVARRAVPRGDRRGTIARAAVAGRLQAIRLVGAQLGAEATGRIHLDAAGRRHGRRNRVGRPDVGAARLGDGGGH